MTYNGSKLYFAYTPDGLPYGVEYGGNQYVYALNLQGDVMAILNASGAKVVEYTYDAWGNVLSVTGSMADTLGQINPLRYRGYVYDNETGLYYLQSRYYDPALGRFINSDGLTSTGQGILGNNMYAYCGNNPIGRMDPTGKSFLAILGLVAIVGLIMCIPSSENQAPYEKAAAKEKYNKNTINFSVDEVGTDPNKLNVTFYPDNGLIHIENSWSISSRYEKEAVISTIMESEFYNATTYGNSKKTMLIEWSAHNFLYQFASSSQIAYDICVSMGYPNPIRSTRSVDFRKELVPSVRRNYNIVTLWGAIQW